MLLFFVEVESRCSDDVFLTPYYYHRVIGVQRARYAISDNQIGRWCFLGSSLAMQISRLWVRAPVEGSVVEIFAQVEAP